MISLTSSEYPTQNGSFGSEPSKSGSYDSSKSCYLEANATMEPTNATGSFFSSHHENFASLASDPLECMSVPNILSFHNHLLSSRMTTVENDASSPACIKFNQNEFYPNSSASSTLPTDGGKSRFPVDNALQNSNKELGQGDIFQLRHCPRNETRPKKCYIGSLKSADLPHSRMVVWRSVQSPTKNFSDLKQEKVASVPERSLPPKLCNSSFSAWENKFQPPPHPYRRGDIFRYCMIESEEALKPNFSSQNDIICSPIANPLWNFPWILLPETQLMASKVMCMWPNTDIRQLVEERLKRQASNTIENCKNINLSPPPSHESSKCPPKKVLATEHSIPNNIQSTPALSHSCVFSEYSHSPPNWLSCSLTAKFCSSSQVVRATDQVLPVYTKIKRPQRQAPVLVPSLTPNSIKKSVFASGKILESSEIPKHITGNSSSTLASLLKSSPSNLFNSVQDSLAGKFSQSIDSPLSTCSNSKSPKGSVFSIPYKSFKRVDFSSANQILSPRNDDMKDFQLNPESINQICSSAQDAHVSEPIRSYFTPTRFSHKPSTPISIPFLSNKSYSTLELSNTSTKSSPESKSKRIHNHYLSQLKSEEDNMASERFIATTVSGKDPNKFRGLASNRFTLPSS